MTTAFIPVRRFLAAVLALLMLAGTLPALAVTSAVSPIAAASYDPDDLLVIKPELREEIAATLPSGMTAYDITLSFPDNAGNFELQGSQDITFTNTTSQRLTELPFRLYANSAAPENDAVTIDRVTIDGAEAVVVLTIDNSVATVTLPVALAPGEDVEISMEFTTRVPQDEPLHYGIFNYASDTETWSLAHWYPVVAGRDPSGGWMLEPTSQYGDPIFTDAGLYTVTVNAPETLTFITSGVETSSTTANDTTTSTFNAWPSRDFVMFADSDMGSVSSDVDGTTITSWHEPKHERAGAAALEWSKQSLSLFNDLLGEYPFLQLQLAEMEIFNAAGVEFPQMISMDRNYYEAQIDPSRPGYFEFTVAHEVVHQWFYNIVGNNQYDHAFIDEGLTNFLSSRTYFDAVRGKEAGDQIMAQNIVRPFRIAVESNSDPIVNFPTDAFPNQRSYVVAAYSKAPLGFNAIHDEMGDDAFFSALRAYVDEFRFSVATPGDLLAAFETETPVEIEPIWTHWFEERNGALDLGR